MTFLKWGLGSGWLAVKIFTNHSLNPFIQFQRMNLPFNKPQRSFDAGISSQPVMEKPQAENSVSLIRFLTPSMVLVCLSITNVWGPNSRLLADWPEFRGPKQNGVAEQSRLPIEWSEEQNIKWFTKTKGLGWSSPVVVGERIYFTSASNAESNASQDADLAGRQRLQLICLNAESGKEIFAKVIFEQGLDAPKIHNKNSHASPTPVVDGGRIYIHFGHQGTACTDLDGNVLWENRDHAFPPTHGNGGSPIVVNDKLVLTCDGGPTPYTLALDLKTGKEVWRRARDVEAERPFSFCTPQLIQVGDQQQIISPGSNVVQALSPTDGKVIWFVRYDGFSVVPRPVFYKDILFVCTGFMTGKLLAIDPKGKGDVTDTHVKWTFGKAVPNTPSILCYENQIVMASDNGIATGVDIATGKELWRERLGGNYSASPLLVGNRVYFQSESGEALVMEIGDKLKEIAKNTLPGRIFASYSVIDNDLIIRTEQGVYRIGQHD
jgi:outer membrane protein assembly factor BamB